MEADSSQVRQAWREQVLIRPLREIDLMALEWEGEFAHFRGIYRHSYERTLQGNAQMWVAELEDFGIIGQVFVLLNNPGYEFVADGRNQARIYSFRVRPQYRNAGIGQRIMQRAEADLLERKFSLVSLLVAKDNPAALRFYERSDYEIIGSEEGNWSYTDHLGQRRDVHEPSWLMQKRLFISS